MSSIAARLDELPRPAWIALMVLGFVFFWPVGLGILAYLIWSGRMSCWRHGGAGRWHEQRDRMRDEARRWWHGERRPPTSGSRAFDEYREDTLRRLEDEQKEFRDFLDRLRHAKDKAEFDQFMADRRRPRDEPRRDEPPRNEPRRDAPPPVPPEPAR